MLSAGVEVFADLRVGAQRRLSDDSVQWILKKQKSVSLDLLAGFGQIFYRVLPKISRFPSLKSLLYVHVGIVYVPFLIMLFQKRMEKGPYVSLPCTVPTIYLTVKDFDSNEGAPATS